jgi:arylsulfatase A-like enzyme
VASNPTQLNSLASRASLRFLLGLLALLSLNCGKPQPPHAELYRLDDHLDSAAVSAPNISSSAGLAEPIVWRFDSGKTGWKAVRGAMGFQDGFLILKGQGGTPVITAPEKPAVDLSRYDSVAIRMGVERGSEVKVRIGEWEQKQKLGPPKDFQVYRFKLDTTVSSFNEPLSIMPSDNPNDIAAIEYIELTPRKSLFAGPAGRLMVGKREEYRNTIYVHSPSTLTYEVPVAEKSSLHFGIGIAENDKPVEFEIRAAAGEKVLYSKKLDDPEIWVDAQVDLSEYAGQTLRLALKTTGEEGAVGLWANPLLTSSAPKRRPNVLVYLIDTLRADHTSLYGYARDTTPFLKKLGAQGIVFDDSQVQSTWTKPSVASMMTSLYSVTHGIFRETDTIPKGASTLAEHLRGAGYVTASIVANPFAGRMTGLDRGFDYVAEFPAVQRHGSEDERATDSTAVNGLAMPWLEEHHDEPFFLYAHSTDPHAPYRPPAEFEARFTDPKETPEFDRQYHELWAIRRLGGAVFSREECIKNGFDPARYVHNATDRYDGEIANNDKNIELLIQQLEKSGVLDNTIVIVVSDHGEEFMEHGWTGHGSTLYQEQTHGIFLMWNPQWFPKPRRVADPVQLIDLMPTILDLLHIPVQGVIQGQSLVPLAIGQPFERKGPVMTSRIPQAATSLVPVPENLTRTFAWIDPQWKLIYRNEAKKAGLNEVELYDRKADPTDRTNVAAKNPKVVERIMPQVQQWIEGQKQVSQLLGPGGQSTMDAQTIERLRSLGYIGGAPK